MKYRQYNGEKTKHDKQNTTPKIKDWTKIGALEGYAVPAPLVEPEPLQEKDTKMVINENRVGHQYTLCVINYRKYNNETECDKVISVFIAWLSIISIISLYLDLSTCNASNHTCT